MISAETDEILYISPAYEQVWGRTCESLYEDPQSWLFAIHPEDSFKALATLETQFRTGDEFQEEYRIVRPDGSIRWVSVNAFPIRDSSGKVNRFVGIAEDITQRKLAKLAMRKSEEQFRLTFEMAPIGMAITAINGQFKRVNQALCEALGYEEQELLKLSFADITYSEDLELHQTQQEALLKNKGSDFQIETRYISRDLQIVDALLKVVIVRDSKGQPLHFNNQIVDITERKHMEKQLLHDALHDSLTGLPNRALFMDRLDHELKRAKAHPDYVFAVLFLDLDRFKVVNDSAGHLVGDQLLIEISRRLEKTVNFTDTVARLGGDEFTILLENIHNIKNAIAVAEKIDLALGVPFKLKGYELFTSASIGIALSSEGYENPDEIMRDADLTMYSAKEQGRARYEIFNSSLHDRAITRLQLETDMRRGIEREEFLIYYQPINSLKTGKLAGFEALARWKHPVRGIVSPAEFIPVAEETGTIIPLGTWIMERACNQMKLWQELYPQKCSLQISVNLSGKQLRDPSLLEKIDGILQNTGLSGEYLKIEITESSLIENMEVATQTLLDIKNRGIKLSMDDFGTGYSSLSYLHLFPVDILKIDRSFVQDIQINKGNYAIVKAIVTLAHVLEMEVIAEGIEDSFQLEQLKLLNCEYGQGYYFAKPLSKQQAEGLIANSIPIISTI
ncbi:PAS domain S-box/diguanylate cyclase (GGDEF) domain-containing protein [Xenococcus sp. PCC 7305]|uniref:bifunctional diguanylate cyclase/phosphodiesterase n=1 Tax=Xenococcus sp. PCC 7305 TaxID=102125 RepID=UPI0002AC2BBB|nr:bifunctional diguanylate cyclase/phosphodiesterase [Xenococcus sp. PCC 7305]ELS02909.1 PAS domain S-box/diguanylate cyclase (GGDEF) domain-containing protein [Xenococcus sp. PCC 7305]